MGALEKIQYKGLGRVGVCYNQIKSVLKSHNGYGSPSSLLDSEDLRNVEINIVD